MQDGETEDQHQKRVQRIRKICRTIVVLSWAEHANESAVVLMIPKKGEPYKVDKYKAVQADKTLLFGNDPESVDYLRGLRYVTKVRLPGPK